MDATLSFVGVAIRKLQDFAASVMRLAVALRSFWIELRGLSAVEKSPRTLLGGHP